MTHDLREERMTKWTRLPFRHLSITPHVWRLNGRRGFLIGYSQALGSPRTMRDIFYDGCEAAHHAIALASTLTDKDDASGTLVNFCPWPEASRYF